jgi:hypothetical protein
MAFLSVEGNGAKSTSEWIREQGGVAQLRTKNDSKGDGIELRPRGG